MKPASSRDIPLGSSQVGAFPLVAGSRDAVLMVTLEPGAYTVEVAAQGAVGGEVLVEVYGVD